MKKLNLILINLLIFSCFTYAQQIRSVELKYPMFKLAVSTHIQPADAEFVPFAMAKHDSLPKKSEKRRFGILFSEDAKNLGRTTLMEIFDAQTNKSIKKISLDEYYGKESANWKLITAESKATAKKITSAFDVKGTDRSFKLIREVEVKDDNNLPTGKGVSINFYIRSTTAGILKAIFYGKAEGVIKTDSSTIIIGSAEPEVKINPMLVVGASPKAQVQYDPNQKKDKLQLFTIIGDTVSVVAQKQTLLFSLNVSGTTVGFKEHIEKQAVNLGKYFRTLKSVPDFAAVTLSDKQSTKPGDTVTYTIIYHNIGSGAGKDIAVNNQIPRGTVYIEESAEGVGSDITFARGPARGNIPGIVSNIQWKFKDLIRPGEERSVKYKVRVL